MVQEKRYSLCAFFTSDNLVYILVPFCLPYIELPRKGPLKASICIKAWRWKPQLLTEIFLTLVRGKLLYISGQIKEGFLKDKKDEKRTSKVECEEVISEIV